MFLYNQPTIFTGLSPVISSVYNPCLNFLLFICCLFDWSYFITEVLAARGSVFSLQPFSVFASQWICNDSKMTMADVLVKASHFLSPATSQNIAKKKKNLKVTAQKIKMKENYDSKTHWSIIICFCWRPSHWCYNGTQ